MSYIRAPSKNDVRCVAARLVGAARNALLGALNGILTPAGRVRDTTSLASSDPFAANVFVSLVGCGARPADAAS